MRSFEVDFFRMLNHVVEPRIRAGLGSPCLAPGGFIVLETRGRRSGRLARVPLAATRIRDHVVVGTFRGQRSQWVKNLAAHPSTRFWLGGRPRPTRAYVLSADRRARPPRDLPAPLGFVLSLLRAYTRAGWAFAVLTPREVARPAARPRAKRARGPRKRKAA